MFFIVLFVFGLSTGCRSVNELKSHERLEHGYTVVLPGIIGRTPFDANIARGLDDANVRGAIEVRDWTKGLFGFGFNLFSEDLKNREAEKLARDIMNYQDQYPGRPVHIIGYSGGAAVTIRTLEALPPDRKVSSAVLLGTGLSPHYNLCEALQKTEELHNFYSPLDLPILGAFVGIVGTTDGRHMWSAGACGFNIPETLDNKERHTYENSLNQQPYRLDMICTCHPGGHFGWTSPLFAKKWLAPLLTPSEETENLPNLPAPVVAEQQLSSLPNESEDQLRR